MNNPGFILALESGNQKTGPMVVSTSCKSTCPDACPLKKGGGCYGEYGPLMMHWRRRSDKQLTQDWRELCTWLRDVPPGRFLRHNQVGDLMGRGDILDGIAAAELVMATEQFKHRYTYTHYPVVTQDAGGDRHKAQHNRRVVEWMTERGFVVNISANSLNHADFIASTGIKCPVVAPVRSDFVENPIRRSAHGLPVITCPAMLTDDKSITCRKCKLCMRAPRSGIIVFPAHGTGKKRANATIDEWDERYKKPAGLSE